MKVVVTGATGALGGAVCERLVRGGDEVHGTYVVDAEAERARGRSPEVRLHRVDVTDEAAVAALFGELGPVDALVHLAGGYVSAPIEATTLAQFDGQVALNLRSFFLCAREAVRTMKPRGSGRIVAVGAKGALDPGPHSVAYAASKAGLHAIVRGLAEELRGTGVSVHAVLPSILDTPANRAAMPGADPSRWVAPADLAEVVATLIAGSFAVTTGALIPVYGRP